MVKNKPNKLEMKALEEQSIINLVHKIRNTIETERKPLYKQLSVKSLEYFEKYNEHFKMPSAGGCYGE